MALTPGTKLGSFEITGLLGAGGMGEVYRARDLNLGREVAVKVLPEALARDAARLARFEREAKLLAALDHPSIASIYEFQQADGVQLLVMQLAEGTTLAERIARGPIPLDDALPIFAQIAAALESAHEQGVIHRDLKPANIKVTENGQVKVLDFGLAKAFKEDSGSHDPSESPTLMSSITGEGMIAGTLPYMSPEQTRGRAVDKRADIWAFGCCLYEALAGRRTFAADNPAELVAEIVKGEPNWDALPAATPARVRILLWRCLQKDPQRRLRDIGDARLDLDEKTSDPSGTFPVSPSTTDGGSLGIRAMAALVFAALAVGTLAGGFLFRGRMEARSQAPLHLNVSPPLIEFPSVMREPAISPDGQFLSYIHGENGGRSHLHLRPLNAFDLGDDPIAGSAGANGPFFSADGQWLGFFMGGALFKVPTAGGSIVLVADEVQASAGASWGEDGMIVFGTAEGGLSRIDPDGGVPSALTQPNTADGKTRHLFPQHIPGSNAILYAALVEGQEPKIVALDPMTGASKELIQQGSHPRYISTGHLLYLNQGRLGAVPFDPARLEVTGLPFVLPIQVRFRTTFNFARTAENNFDCSADGTLVYAPVFENTDERRRVVWVTREGVESPFLDRPLGLPKVPRFSPDGRRLALLSGLEGQGFLWIYDLSGGPPLKLSRGVMSAWTPDGKNLAFEAGPLAVRIIASDGSALEPEVLFEGHHHPLDFTSHGRELFYVKIGPNRNAGIWAYPTDPETGRAARDGREPRPVVDTPYNAGYDGARLSPDGKWLAYASNRSGRAEIWVRPIPGPGVPRQVSVDGGIDPTWARDGGEVFFWDRDRPRMMSVRLETEEGLTIHEPETLFEGNYYRFGQAPTYDVHPDGRFVMIKGQEGDPGPPDLRVIVNWFDEIERLTAERK